MAKKYPAASDFPPGSQPWRRAIEAESKALRKQVDRLTREHEYTKAATNAAVANTGANAGRALGMLIGLGDTQPLILSVSTESYLTESGQPAAYIQITWEYDASDTGFDYADNGVQTELWARPVEAAPPLPDLDGEVIPGDPDLDSARVTAIAMPQTTGKIYKLECNTQYAVKIRQTSAVGAPGPYSDEMLITTPDEPDLRDPGAPSLSALPGGVGVTWGWNPETVPESPGYPEVLGFDVVSTPLVDYTSGERLFHIGTAPNGKVYGVVKDISTSGTPVVRYVVASPDGSQTTWVGSLLEAVSSHLPAYQPSFAAGPDGNLYGVVTGIRNNPPTTPYQYVNIHFDPAGSASDPYEIIWKIDTSTDTMSYVAREAAVMPSLDPLDGATAAFPTSDGIGIYFSHPSALSASGTGYIQRIDTSTLTETFVPVTLPTTDPTPPSGLGHYGAQVSRELIRKIDDNTIAIPITCEQYAYGPSHEAIFHIYLVDINTGAFTSHYINGADAGPLSGETGSTNGISVSIANDGTIFAKKEWGTSGAAWTLDLDETSGDYNMTPILGGSFDQEYQAVVYGYAFGPVYVDRGFVNGVQMFNFEDPYTYAMRGGNTHPVPWLFGDTAAVFENPGTDAVSVTSAYRDDIYPRSNFVSGVLDSDIVWTISRAGVAYLTPKPIDGQDTIPEHVDRPAKLWPEIKGVLIERLSPAGWVEIGSRITTGTTFDPVPSPGTYTYRFIPIGITNKIAPPTDSTSITI